MKLSDIEMLFEQEGGITLGNVSSGRICTGKSYAPSIYTLVHLLDSQGLHTSVEDGIIFATNSHGVKEDVTGLFTAKVSDLSAFCPTELAEYPINNYYSPADSYFEGSLIVPASNKTKGNHAYPWYHGGKW